MLPGAGRVCRRTGRCGPSSQGRRCHRPPGPGPLLWSKGGTCPKAPGTGQDTCHHSGSRARRAAGSRVSTAIFTRRSPPGDLRLVGGDISPIAKPAARGRVGADLSQGRRQRPPTCRQGGPGSEPTWAPPYFTRGSRAGDSEVATLALRPDSYLPQPHLSTRLLKGRCGCPPAWARLPCLWGHVGLTVTHQGTRAPASRRPLCFSLRNVSRGK